MLLLSISSDSKQSPPAFYCVVSNSLYPMHQRHIERLRILFLFLFYVHAVCQRHLWDVRPYASLSVFLDSGAFIEVLLFFTLILFTQPLRSGRMWHKVNI